MRRVHHAVRRRPRRLSALRVDGGQRRRRGREARQRRARGRDRGCSGDQEGGVMAKATVHTGSLTADEIAAAAEAEAVTEEAEQADDVTTEAPAKRKYTRKTTGS